MNIIEHNRHAWNRESSKGGEWSTPVTAEAIRKAREGEWSVVLTPTRAVPASWFEDVRGKDVLCLASGGGQQAPILAAAGANVISYDLSDEQLAKDRHVADRDDLALRCVQGDMNDLSRFADGSFDLIFHPVSNLFIPDVRNVWRECYRVMKGGGSLLAGFMNPSIHLFDHEEAERTGTLAVKFALPYAEPDSLDADARRRWSESGRPAEFSHSLEAQIGGQLDAGFALTGLYEDSWSDKAIPLNRFSPVAVATRAVKVVLAGIIALCGLCALSQPLLAQSPSEVIALTGGRVIPSADAGPIDAATVVIENGIISAVGPRARVAIPASARTIDCTGLFVVAGFQNNHVHFTEDTWADAKSQPAPKLAAQLQAMLTRYGFTTVVDTASLLPNTVELRWRVETGVPGPRILTAGLALYPPNGVPYYVKDAVPPQLLRLLPQPATAALASEIVRRNIEGGANVIKLFTGSVVSRGQVIAMPQDVATAAVTEAHRLGKLVFAHPSNVAGLEGALNARVDVLAHVVEADAGLTPNHLRRMKSGDVALVPTLKLLAEDGAGGVRVLLDQVRDYAKGGGQILFGTDVGYLSDYDPAREYFLMEAAGLTWRQILASLTTNPASRFKESSQRGRVARGMEADIVVLGSDPALGSRAFTDVRYVIREGRILYEK